MSMNRFELARAKTAAEARDLLGERPGSVFKAGGIDLLDHLKERLLEPPRVVDLKPIPGMNRIAVEADGSLRIGPLATLAQVAAHDGVRGSHAALAQACGEAASPQIRNVATIGGNVLQRPRCWYYRLESYKCLKKGGDVCFAVGGENRYHSVFGGGPSYAVHPSNAAVPLLAFGAALVLEGPKGARTVAAADFFTLPSKDPERENQLLPGEILTEIRVPSAAGAKSAYRELREKAAFDWPLVSTAAVVRTEAGVVREARVVLGAVAPIPWRSAKAEQALVGKALDEGAAVAAARAAIFGAVPLSDNGYKVGLVQTLVRRTLMSIA
jgi:xanthine dehydrogenase YagS FAD-binding subunit